ncbi:MAG: YfhO family protein [Bacteroidota bacterium]
MRPNIQSILQHVSAISIFIIAACFYFSPQFSGKVVTQSDIIGYRGMSQELRAYKEKTGEEALWTNSMFSGMPSYQINTVSSGNLIKKLENVIRAFIKPPAGQFIAAMISFYLLMVLLGVNPWLSVAGAIAFGFATNNLILYEAGHETKLKTISYLPLVASGMLLAFRKRYLLGGILFGLGLGLDLAANHVQMTYYFFMTVIIWGVAELINNVRQQTLPHFGKAAGALIIGGLLALGSAASNLWVTYEYAQDTMRGAPILEKAASAPGATSSSEVEGLEFGYAMQWSNGGLDLAASFIPGVAGGGSSEPVSSDSPFGRTLRRFGGGGGDTLDAPLYHGALPFTSGPIYFGAVMILFFIVGLFLVEGPVKWWLGLGVLLTLLLSMGKNLEGFNRFFFDYFPLYNKFRTPNSVLSVTAFLIPVLAVLSLHEIFNGDHPKEKIIRSLAIGTGITAAIALFFAFVGPGMFDFTNPRDAQAFGQGDPQIISALVNSLEETRAQLMQADALRSLFLVLLSAGAVYGFAQGKLQTPVALSALVLLTGYDLLGVGSRYLNKDDFERRQSVEQIFAPSPADQQILADPDPHYRVYDTRVSIQGSAQPSYHHKSVGGYHAAKLQRYQDLIDRHLGVGNQAAFDMLNTKYFIIQGQDGQPVVQRNPNANGNAWFVDSVFVVPNANVEIDALSNIPLKTSAAVHKEFKNYISSLSPSGAGTIQLTEYRPNKLTYQASVDQEELAVFSEVWYGPDKGWQAYIDGEPAEHIRVNYILRALKIPAGQHEIVFEFAPRKFYLGQTVSLASSALLILALLAFIGWTVKNREEEEVAPEPAPATSSKPKTKKTSKKKKK